LETLTVATDKATTLGGTLTVVTGKATSLGGTLGVTGATTLTNATASTSKTTGTLVVTGGVGVGGNVHATRFFGDGSQLDGIATTLQGVTENDGNVTTITTAFNNNENAIVTVGRVGIGLTNPSANLHVNGNAFVSSTTPSTSTGTGAFVVTGGVGIGGNTNVGGKVSVPGDGDFVMDSKPLKAATGLSWDRNASRLNVAGSVSMTGGLITNTSGVRKKTYSQTGAHSGTASLGIVFSDLTPFSAKVTAHLIGTSISTLIYDCTGGKGTSIVNGPISIFGGAPAWNSTITTTATSITITPAATGATSYAIFVEYISASATGSVTTIAGVSTGY
jgi:hypothetical protein